MATDDDDDGMTFSNLLHGGKFFCLLVLIRLFLLKK